MKFIGIIPARYASIRFPGKPLVDIGGKPMIQRVFEQAKRILKEVYVATDDIRIRDAVTAFGGKAVMTSLKHKSGTDRCAEALGKIEKTNDKTYDVVVNIQGDEPFIQPTQIAKLMHCFETSGTQIATLIKPIENSEDLFNPNKPKVLINKDMEAIYFSRSTIPYVRNFDQNEWIRKHGFFKHIGMYAYTTEVLKQITRLPPSSLEVAESLEQLRWIENNICIRVSITHEETIGIDTPEDLEKLIKSGEIIQSLK